MSLNKYLILMTLTTIVCWAVWAMVINIINPTQAGFLGFLFFYASLFLASIGSISIIGFFIRKVLLREELAFRHVVVSFRQAILLSILIIGSLILQSRGLLTWWNTILFILALTVLEFFFISFKKQTHT